MTVARARLIPLDPLDFPWCRGYETDNRSVRYLTDEQIRAVASTGGIVCPSPTPLGPGDEVSSVENVLNHIDYMVDLVGPDYVGFGTDFLGQTDWRSAAFGDISESRNIIKDLMERDMPSRRPARS
ncbi:uncharacterized protein METZ01_LOCUS222044 [marine metagenome]|uniref:Uncharacterized protein n=1 Tax=marine metagenome TaxID=408172 RepID=A0A382G1T2_9ZZZZ